MAPSLDTLLCDEAEKLRELASDPEYRAFVGQCGALGPIDDLHRLVFADWLDERRLILRAQFIRIECGTTPDPVFSAAEKAAFFI